MLEAGLHGVVELVLGGRDEHCSSPSALAHKCIVEVHDPTVRCFFFGREWMIRLQRIYNVLLFHAIILSVLDVHWALLYTFILFLGLTY